MTTSATEAQLMHEIESIKSYLTAAQDVVKSGHMPDMAGLENRIAILCESVQKAVPDIQQVCLPELFALIEHLNVCEKIMRESRKPETEEEKKS